jgi:hypothetical protein
MLTGAFGLRVPSRVVCVVQKGSRGLPTVRVVASDGKVPQYFSPSYFTGVFKPRLHVVSLTSVAPTSLHVPFWAVQPQGVQLRLSSKAWK